MLKKKSEYDMYTYTHMCVLRLHLEKIRKRLEQYLLLEGNQSTDFLLSAFLYCFHCFLPGGCAPVVATEIKVP